MEKRILDYFESKYGKMEKQTSKLPPFKLPKIAVENVDSFATRDLAILETLNGIKCGGLFLFGVNPGGELHFMVTLSIENFRESLSDGLSVFDVLLSAEGANTVEKEHSVAESRMVFLIPIDVFPQELSISQIMSNDFLARYKGPEFTRACETLYKNDWYVEGPNFTSEWSVEEDDD